MRFLAPTTLLFAASTLAAKVHTVYQFPQPTWLENIAATRNGSLLVSTIGVAEVHLVNPIVEPSTVSLAASFPNSNAVLGITELTDNTFAVAVGNTTPANTPVPQTFAIWKLHLSNNNTTHGTTTVEKIADVPDLGMVNGLAALNSHTLLLADSWKGNVVKLDTKTKTYSVFLEHPSLAANFSAPALPLGVNGIKVHGDFVYYSNTVQALLGRVRVHRKSGKAIGPFTIIAAGPKISVPDDFAVAKDGSVYVAGPLAAPKGDTLQHVALDGKVETVEEGGLVAGATGVAFGRTEEDKGVVYLSTMGGFGGDGKPLAGGRVVAVTLDEGSVGGYAKRKL